eukprot:maker-scaffold370_size193435-snap-gene-0.43 protein:Tk07798 transcript:maker-scaffold370_size193435-snap-gene-0.43-mRNA-1 annotation:"unknown"
MLAGFSEGLARARPISPARSPRVPASPRGWRARSQAGEPERAGEIGDLRLFLKGRNRPAGAGGAEVDVRVQVAGRRKSRRTVLLAEPASKKGKSPTAESVRAIARAGTTQELYIGNLFNEVEVSDVERLLEEYGRIVQVKMFSSYALAVIECAQDRAEAAIQTLDMNLWMDNNIRVKFNLKPPLQRPEPDQYAHSDRTPDEPAAQVSRAPRPRSTKVKPDVIEAYLSGHRDARAPGDGISREDMSRFELDPQKRARNFIIAAQVRPRQFLADMKDIFSSFGHVLSCVELADSAQACLSLISNESKALKCIKEVNALTYKGSQLNVLFEFGSLEDTPAYRQRFSLYFRNYPHDLRSASSQAGPSATTSEVPIGVLPPSSSLGAFGATPDASTLNSIIQNVRASMAHGLGGPSKSAFPEVPSSNVGPALPRLTSDPDYISSVEAQICSVHNKIVVISFFTGFSFQCAKLVPGQMYVNGKKSLGYLIKNNNFQTWPEHIKSFLHQGVKIKMDARRMSPEEVEEVSAISPANIQYCTPLIWQVQKPQEEDITVSMSSHKYQVLRGTVVRLYAKWGVLRHPLQGEVFFEVSSFFEINKCLSAEDSLLPKVAIGDVLATQCYSVGYLAMTEYLREVTLFEGTTEALRYRAKLVWSLTKEIDPFALSHEEGDQPCQFLTTSSTLNRQLPGEKEASHRGWPGVIEEIHLPAGGVILLDESLGLDLQHRRVYFHRSRLYLNGAKIQSNNSLDDELVPGDPVTVDVVLNQNPEDGADGAPYVYSCAFWVALTAQANTRTRGEFLAQKLRAEEDASVQAPESPMLGRVIQLFKPAESLDSVTGGVAVIDYGPFAGQRVEFEREQCQAFGHPFGKADLSYIFSPGQVVRIKVKPYNSFCVESLSIGSKSQGDLEDQDALEKFLRKHLMDYSYFTSVVRGRTSPRPFIPFPAQMFGAKIQSLHASVPSQGVISFVAEVEVGEASPMQVEVHREDFYVYGHWMGRADLKYLIDKESVCLEFCPALPSHVDNSSTMPRASLAWLGCAGDRPQYQGSTSRLQMTPEMDTSLWSFVKAKGLDERTFRALVEGRLPPKPVEESEVQVADPESGTVISLDKETLAQAALLKQMKESFGGQACMEALMLLMQQQRSQAQGAGPSSSGPRSPSIIEKIKEELGKRDENASQD